MKTILFQGDSITDAGRNGDAEFDLGKGYPIHVAAKLDRMYPNEYKFYNRGISGHKVTDLIGRWKRDCINLKPDYISILIGVNDVWHEVCNSDGTDTQTFEQVYDILLGITKKYLPDVKLFLMEPFFLKDAYNPELKEAFAAGVAEKREVVKKLAAKYGLKTIPLQEIFEDAMKSADEFWWTAEGVHPTNAGHQVIADAWVELFEEIK